MIGSEKSPASTYHMIAKELLINLAINMLPSNQTTSHFFNYNTFFLGVYRLLQVFFMVVQIKY